MSDFLKSLIIFITLSQASCDWFAAKTSKDILDEFKLVSDGMKESNKLIDQKNSSLIETLRKQYERDSVFNKPFYTEALKVIKLSDDFAAYEDTLKEYLIRESGGYADSALTEMKDKRDFETPTRIMLEERRGKELKSRIEKLRQDLLAVESLDSTDVQLLSEQFTLNTRYNIKAAEALGKKSWEEYLFQHVLAIAVNTILTKLQGDAKNSAGLVIEAFSKKFK